MEWLRIAPTYISDEQYKQLELEAKNRRWGVSTTIRFILEQTNFDTLEVNDLYPYGALKARTPVILVEPKTKQDMGKCADAYGTRLSVVLRSAVDNFFKEALVGENA